MEEIQNKKIITILTWVIAGMLAFVIILLAFTTGVWVGQERAGFSFQWAENYHRNFGGPPTGFFGNFPARDFTNGHGGFGKIIAIDSNSVVIKDEESMEKTITLSGDTTVRDNFGLTTLSALKVGDLIVVIGSPDNQGQIDAKFIRIMPAESSFLINLYDGQHL